MKKYVTAPSIAWQDIDDIDYLYIINRKTNENFYFSKSSRFIVTSLLENIDLDLIIKSCNAKFCTEKKDSVADQVTEFISCLFKKGLFINDE